MPNDLLNESERLNRSRMSGRASKCPEQALAANPRLRACPEQPMMKNGLDTCQPVLCVLLKKGLMRIAGLQKLTLLDFPERTAATVFLPGCNFRCPFCHNAELVVGDDACGLSADDVPLDDFFAFLDKRQGLLDGICITGGEPLLQPDLAEFCARIKQAGFAVKLDTNGSFPNKLQKLVETGLVDYVAMDVKNCRARYGETVGRAEAETTNRDLAAAAQEPSGSTLANGALDLDAIEASIAYLQEDHLPYEFRTTVVRELHAPDDLLSLARWIAGARAWYLQSFVDADSVLAGPGRLHAYEPSDLEAQLPELRRYVPNTQLRGV